MKFRPLHDRVVVKRLTAEEKSAGGIIIPDTAQEKPSQGEVTAIGPGGRDDLAFHRLFLGGIRDDDATPRFLFLTDAPDQHAVVQWTETHPGSPWIDMRHD